MALDSPQHDEYLPMLFEQFLCCFRHHSEAWLAYAQFLASKGQAKLASNVFREGIEVLPTSELLRVSLADTEEQWNSPDAAREVLKTGFQALGTPFMFCAYQKFLRRSDGIVAARRAFTEYLALAMKTDRSIDPGVPPIILVICLVVACVSEQYINEYRYRYALPMRVLSLM